jgi:hypothetical protein
MDFKKTIIDYLDSIKNDFNELRIENRKDNISKTLERLKDYKEKIISGEWTIDDFLEAFFGHLKVESILTLNSVSLFDEPAIWAIRRKVRHGNYDRWSDIYRVLKDKCSKTEAIKLAEKMEDIYTREFTEVPSIKVPSGKLLFSNYFLNNEEGDNKTYAFNVPEDLKYDDWFSLNSKFGRQNMMTYLAKEYNIGYCQLGNRTVGVYKVDNDRIYLAPTSYYDDVTDRDIEPTKKWEYLGDIDCSVWRVEFIDEILFDSNNNIDKDFFEEEDNVIVEVTPGTWTAHNYYHCKSDKSLVEKFGYPVWIEINRIK